MSRPRPIKTCPLGAQVGFVAMQFFAELWASELYRLGEQNDRTATLARTTAQSASHRASTRTAACAGLVLATTQQKHAGFFAPNDPALKAKQSGRDAGSLARRVRTFGDASSVRIGFLREVAKAMNTIALAMKQNVSPTLASEPLQAFFIDPASGHYAYHRCSQQVARLNELVRRTNNPNALQPQNTTLSNTILCSAAAAYPSLRLDVAQHPTTLGRARVPPMVPPENHLLPERPSDIADAASMVAHLQRRCAKLRVDVPPCESIHPDGMTRTVDEITSKFATFDIVDNQIQLAQFYVPFGYGEPPPALKATPISAVMFGSVPVWTEDVRVNATALRDTMQGGARAPMRSAVILPTLACTEGRKAISSPVIINVSRNGTSPTDLRYAFHASQFAVDTLGPSVPSAAPVDARTAALQFLQTSKEQTVADGVCELAWNAERVLQCILLSVAQDSMFPPEFILDIRDPDYVLMGDLQERFDAATRNVEYHNSIFVQNMHELLFGMRTAAVELDSVPMVESAPIDNQDVIQNFKFEGFDVEKSSSTGVPFARLSAQSNSLSKDLRTLKNEDIEAATDAELNAFYNNFAAILQRFQALLELDADVGARDPEIAKEKVRTNETFKQIQTLQNKTVASKAAYIAAEGELDALDAAMAASRTAHDERVRQLRLRLVAATVIGAALGRALLGATHAPRVVEVMIDGHLPALSHTVARAEIVSLLDRLAFVFETPGNALRLSEVCCITFGILNI